MVRRLLLRLRDTIRSGIISRLLRSVGLEEALSGVFYRLYFAIWGESVVEVDGIEGRFVTSNRAELYRLENIGYERDILGEFLDRLEADDVVYDVGANIGLYTVLAAKMTPRGQVVAFEPEPENYRRLNENVEVNGLGNVRTYRVALSDQRGEGVLHLEEGGVGQGDHSLLQVDGPGQTLTVETHRGDEFAESEGLDPPTILKIDVEGAELGVVEGLEDTLRDGDCRLVFCEAHPELLDASGDSVESLIERMTSLGFELDEEMTTGDREHLVFHRESGN